MALISLEELVKKDIKEPEFFIAPYIVKQGVTLLWARRSVGKSALSWRMAAEIGRGGHFFGLPVKQGKVLYIEVDSPESIVASRLRAQPVAPNVWYYIKPGTFGLPNPRRETEDELKEAQAIIKPDVVFLNTLRKLHRFDDKESSAPSEVYGYFQHLFPQAALVFIHHNKKTAADPKFRTRKDESFSGSSHWIDDAQSGLYFTKYRGDNFNRHLEHMKGQGSAKLRPLPLKLDLNDGTSLSCPIYETFLRVYTLMNEREEKGKDLDKVIAKDIGVEEITAYKYRHRVIEGKFGQGSYHWMDKERGFEVEGDDDEEE